MLWERTIRFRKNHPESLKLEEQRGGESRRRKKAFHEIPSPMRPKDLRHETSWPIPQHSLQNPARLKTFKKTERSQAQSRRFGQEPAPVCRRTSGKMCRHNPTGYIPAVTGANDLFNFGRFSRYSLKYTVFNQHDASPRKKTERDIFFP